MKNTTTSHLSILLALLFTAISLGAQPTQSTGTLYWDPEALGPGSGTASGGSGTNVGTTTADSGHATSLWYNGTATNVSFNTTRGAASYNNLVFGAYTGSSPAASYSLNVTSTSGFARIKSLSFYDNYIIGSTSGCRTISGNNSTDSGYAGLKIYIDTGKTLTLNSSFFRIISNASDSDVSSPAIQLTGAGSINFDNGFLLDQSNANSGVYMGNAGAVTTININNSTVNAKHLSIGGAVVSLGDLSSVNVVTTANGDALRIGNQITDTTVTSDFGNSSGVMSTAVAHSASVINMNGGQLVATSTTGAGISFGAGHNNAIGGTLNLNGGELTTTNIVANPNAAYSGNARLSFNGTSIKVSSTANQSQLDNFVSGFKDSANNKATIDEGGLHIDTSDISASTNGVATISSNLSGTGELHKEGSNALRLTGNNSYSGSTYVLNGTLIVDGAITASDVYLDPGTTLGGSGSLANVEAWEAVTIKAQQGLSIDSLSILGDITIDLDLSSVINSLQSLASLGALIDASGGNAEITINLSGINAAFTGYTLLTISGQNDFTEANFTLAGESTSLTLSFDGNSLVLGSIPEPATNTLILALAALAFICISRFRRKQ